MSEDCHDSNNVPHIAAQCAHCGFIFDVKFGVECPACRRTGTKWARLVTEQEAQERGAYAQQELRHALDQWSQEDVAWCEKLFALDNEGSQR